MGREKSKTVRHGWGWAQAQVREIDRRADVKFFPKAQAGWRYAVGFRLGDRSGTFVPVCIGPNWENVVDALRALKVKMDEDAAKEPPPIVGAPFGVPPPPGESGVTL